MASEIIMTSLGLEEIGDYVEARMRKVLIEHESKKEEKFIKRNEAAKILCCTPDTVSSYVTHGKLNNYSPTPGRFLLKKSEVINCRKFKNRFK
jgi:hypothetical protein